MIKDLTVQQVYNHLCIQFGKKEAEDIMDSLEGDTDGYHKIKETIIEKLNEEKFQ